MESKKNNPMSLAQLSSDRFPGPFFFRGVCPFLVRQCTLFVFFSCFLGSWEKISPWQASIGWHNFYSSTFYSSVLAIKQKIQWKQTLSPTSLGTPLDWCFIGMPRFVSQSVKGWHMFFKPGIIISDNRLFFNGVFQQKMLYENMFASKWLPLQKGNLVSLTTRSLWRRMLFIVVFPWKKQVLFCRMPLYFSWQPLQVDHFLRKRLCFFAKTFFCLKV